MYFALRHINKIFFSVLIHIKFVHLFIRVSLYKERHNKSWHVIVHKFYNLCANFSLILIVWTKHRVQIKMNEAADWIALNYCNIKFLRKKNTIHNIIIIIICTVKNQDSNVFIHNRLYKKISLHIIWYPFVTSDKNITVCIAPIRVYEKKSSIRTAWRVSVANH